MQGLLNKVGIKCSFRVDQCKNAIRLLQLVVYDELNSSLQALNRFVRPYVRRDRMSNAGVCFFQMNDFRTALHIFDCENHP